MRIDELMEEEMKKGALAPSRIVFWDAAEAEECFKGLFGIIGIIGITHYLSDGVSGASPYEGDVIFSVLAKEN